MICPWVVRGRFSVLIHFPEEREHVALGATQRQLPNSGSGELRFMRQDAVRANLVSGGIFAIPNHNPSIREKEFLVAGPFFTTAPSWVLGFLRIPPTVDRNLVEDESLFYAVFIFAPSGMTPSLT
jgi:hypothetical protein